MLAKYSKLVINRRMVIIYSPWWSSGLTLIEEYTVWAGLEEWTSSVKLLQLAGHTTEIMYQDYVSHDLEHIPRMK